LYFSEVVSSGKTTNIRQNPKHTKERREKREQNRTEQNRTEEKKLKDKWTKFRFFDLNSKGNSGLTWTSPFAKNLPYLNQRVSRDHVFSR